MMFLPPVSPPADLSTIPGDVVQLIAEHVEKCNDLKSFSSLSSHIRKLVAEVQFAHLSLRSDVVARVPFSVLTIAK